MPSVSRDPLLFLEDIELRCARIIEYTQGLTQEEALTDSMRLDAVLMNLHTIGEAVKNLPEEMRQQYQDVPWRQISGMRDFVANVYFAIDIDIVWDTVQNDVPALLERIREIIADVKQPDE
jgi:uncharacterized protein with HEPN domain